jgi:hypothetical protein
VRVASITDPFGCFPKGRLSRHCHSSRGKTLKNGEQRVSTEEELALALDRNCVIPLGNLPLRQILIKLLKWLLTEMLEVRILPGEPKFFGFKQLQNLGRAFGFRPNAWAREVKLQVSMLLNQKLFSVARPRSTSAVIKTSWSFRISEVHNHIFRQRELNERVELSVWSRILVNPQSDEEASRRLPEQCPEILHGFDRTIVHSK